MNDTAVKTPWHLWAVGVIAVLFNAIGVFDFVMSVAQGPAYLASAGMTPQQIAHYANMPVWMIGVWALGVFGALLASFLLLLRRRTAFVVFIVSTAAFLMSLVYTYLLSGDGAVMGQQMAMTSAVIAVLLALFCLYAYAMGRRPGLLR